MRRRLPLRSARADACHRGALRAAPGSCSRAGERRCPMSSVCFEVHAEQDNGEITYQCGADWVGGWRLVALWRDDATEAAVEALGRGAVEDAARAAFLVEELR